MHTKRSVRVAELLKREISRIIVEEIKDPAINFITITNVKISEDLRFSKIYFTVLGDMAHRKKATERLERATKFIRNKIGGKLDLRYVPEIKFYYDTLSNHIENIENLLLKIKEGNNN